MPDHDLLAGLSLNGTSVPSYDRRGLTAGIVHIGVGNFHRAHQAVVIDRLLEQGLARDFAICGVGVLAGDARMRDVMQGQDGLYLLELRNPDGTREARIIGSIIEYLFAPDDPDAVVTKMADPRTRIVSLTITEGGYHHENVPPGGPPSVFDLVVAALRRRRDAGEPPFTVMSCDNLPLNGDTARRAFASFARLTDPEMANWIQAEVAFPNSMVDRITPATTDEDRRHARDDLGIDDGWPVASEPFFQWVLEEGFPAGRPPFEEAGVQVVDAVEPYELMKLRLLNASHQALAYFGSLAGYTFVDEAIADADLRSFVRAYMAEALPTLPSVPGVDLGEYQQTLLERFSNPAIRDTLARLCAETSDRIPRFLLPVVADNLAAGRASPVAAAIVASWARYAEGTDEQGGVLEISDRRAEERRLAAKRELESPGAFLENRELFGDVADNDAFVSSYVETLAQLHREGARATYAGVAASL